jgi:hypothetical protein
VGIWEKIYMKFHTGTQLLKPGLSALVGQYGPNEENADIVENEVINLRLVNESQRRKLLPKCKTSGSTQNAKWRQGRS